MGENAGEIKVVNGERDKFNTLKFGFTAFVVIAERAFEIGSVRMDLLKRETVAAEKLMTQSDHPNQIATFNFVNCPFHIAIKSGIKEPGTY